MPNGLNKMSKVISFALIAIIVSTGIISCKKDNNVVVPVNKGVITGMISNTSTSFNLSDENISLIRSYSNDSIPQLIYNLNAVISKSPLKMFTIRLKGPLKANAYGFGSKQAQASYNIGTTSNDLYTTTADSSVISGIVNLSTYSADTLIGTYHVTFTNPIGNKFDITGGTFNCTFVH